MAKVAAKAKDRPVKKKQTAGMRILTILFSIVSVFYVAPVFIVLMNSFKSNAAISRAIFEFPNADSFQGFQSYMTGMFHGNYPFWKSIVWSFFITIGGVVLILSAHQCVRGTYSVQILVYAKSSTTSAFSQWLFLSRW